MNKFWKMWSLNLPIMGILALCMLMLPSGTQLILLLTAVIMSLGLVSIWVFGNFCISLKRQYFDGIVSLFRIGLGKGNPGGVMIHFRVSEILSHPIFAVTITFLLVFIITSLNVPADAEKLRDIYDTFGTIFIYVLLVIALMAGFCLLGNGFVHLVRKFGE